MAFDDERNSIANTLSFALIAGGVSIAGYKGWQDYGASKFTKATELSRIRSSEAYASLGQVSRNRPVFEADQLEEAFSTMENVMSTGGRKEFLRRAYTRAMYSSRVVSDDARRKMVDELLDAGTKWSSVKSALLKRETELGGTQNVYRMMRELAGGTVRGSRGESLSELLWGMDPTKASGPNRRPGSAEYTRSAFEPGGSYWRDLFPGEEKIFNVSEETVLQQRRGILPEFNKAAKTIESQMRELGVVTAKYGVPMKVTAGLRDIGTKSFQGGISGSFQASIPGLGKVDVPFYQVRLGGRSSQAVINVPIVSEATSKVGLNLVAADATGEAFGVLPKFAIPARNGVGYEIVDTNKAISMMIHGDPDRGIEGLALRLQKYHKEGKTARDLAKDVNTQISSLLYRVHGSSGDMTRARLHSQSVVHLPNFVAGIKPESAEDVQRFAKELQASPAIKGRWDIGPLASPDPMSKAYHLSLHDFAKRWDIYGEHFPTEKRYLQKYREFGLSTAAEAEMASKPIFGILGRGTPLTATARGAKGAHQMPMVVGAYRIRGSALNLGEEEAVISRDLAKMMETRTVKQLRVKVGDGFGIGTVGNELMEGKIIGTDYVTGETYKAARRPGHVSERVISGKKVGDVAFLELETTFPGQDLTKIFGPKAVYHLAREDHGVSKELWYEFNVRRIEKSGLLHTLTKKGELEFIAHAGTLKGGMADVLKQMSEASWIVGAKKPEITHTRNLAEIKSSRQRALWQFVHKEDVRRGVMEGWNREGMAAGHGAEGVGVQILAHAKKMGFTPEEMGLIGGLYMSKLDSNTRGNIISALKKSSLTDLDIQAMNEAEVVLGMPTMHIGEYGSQRWQRARMDPRALNELASQQYGEGGELLVRELARRVEPEQSYIEMDMALKSALGKGTSSVPAEVKRIKNIDDAKKALGREGFILEGAGKDLYVPGPAAKGMLDYYPEVGTKPIPEYLKGSYLKYLSAAEKGGDLEAARFSLAKGLEVEYSKAVSSRGNVIGAEAQMARRWLGATPEQSMAKTMSEAEFMRAGDAFTVGIGREPAERMFKEMLGSNLSKEEKAFVEAQRSAFFKGESITGALWRHPTHRPQSLVPARFQYVKDASEGMMFKNYRVIGTGGKGYDVSLAQGMKLDYDADRAYGLFVANEKVKRSLDELMRGPAYRKAFVEGVYSSTELQRLAKEVAKRAGSGAEESKFIEGLNRMIGVKMETGAVSSNVSKMRSAAAFSLGKEDYSAADYILAELEEAPISSRHGMNVAKVNEALHNFVYNKGVGNEEGLREVWMSIWGQEEIQAGNRKYRLDKFVTDMTNARKDAKDSQHFAAFEATIERQSAASKGRQIKGDNAKLISSNIEKAINFFETAKGSPTAPLIRELRMGPGSMIAQSRELVAGAKSIGGIALQAFKKHWKYPTAAVAGAVAMNWLVGSSSMGASRTDPNTQATELANSSPGSVHVPPPFGTRTIIAGGQPMGAGYEASASMDFGSRGLQQLSNFGAEVGGNVRIRDDRGAITPEYIDKAQRERYY